MKRYIKGSNLKSLRDYGLGIDDNGDVFEYGKPRSYSKNVTGKHPLDVLFPSMGDWFEEDVCACIDSILGFDEGETRLTLAKRAGEDVTDPWDYSFAPWEVYDFIDDNPEYRKKLDKYIDEHQDMIEWDLLQD
jgi:hypothetical protein